MNKITLILFLCCIINIGCNDKIVSKSDIAAKSATESKQSVYDFEVDDIDGNKVSLSKYKNQVMLIVNTASECGLTPQYKDLQELYDKYKDKDFVILGFPANNFMGQEPGNNTQIKQFCEANFGVTFPMFSKISVKGNDIAPLYKYLTSKDLNGVLDASVSWNFQKFLIDKNGNIVASFSPKTTVKEEKFINILEELL